MTIEVTKEVRMQLVGLKALADHHNRQLDEIVEATAALVGMSREDDPHGWLTDFVYDPSLSVAKFLKHASPPSPAPSSSPLPIRSEIDL